MKNGFFSFLWVLCALTLSVSGLRAATLPSDPGIYAVIDTNLGSMVARLDYEKAPMTVANFIGLATGERGWIDLNTGLLRFDPFYNGITFHRVVDGFVNQFGSPNGQGTDGPGYSFLDEFDPALRHDLPGILSMANSGRDTNGSQIFITAVPTPGLDDVHSVFGTVVSGLDVNEAINQVPVDGDDKPLTDVVIQNIMIVRQGAKAEAFDIHAQGLPTPGSAAVVLDAVTESVEVERQAGSMAWLSRSGDLAGWSVVEAENYTDSAETAGEPTTSFGPDERGFFQATEVIYPNATAPQSLVGRTIRFTSSGVTAEVTFKADGLCDFQLLSITDVLVDVPYFYLVLSGYRMVVDMDPRGQGIVYFRYFFGDDPVANEKIHTGTAFTTPTPSSLSGTWEYLP